jgi:hypothetical protein
MSTTAKLVEPWRVQIKHAAEASGFSPYLLGAIVVTESSGQQYAQRVERGFWPRYLAGIRRWVASTASQSDDKWSQYPDIYSSSYGLCQVMLQTAAEHGFVYHYPGQLFDPEENLRVACRILSRIRARTGDDVRALLLAYNGGGDPMYPNRVLRHLNALKDAQVW